MKKFCIRIGYKKFKNVDDVLLMDDDKNYKIKYKDGTVQIVRKSSRTAFYDCDDIKHEKYAARLYAYSINRVFNDFQHERDIDNIRSHAKIVLYLDIPKAIKGGYNSLKKHIFDECRTFGLEYSLDYSKQGYRILRFVTEEQAFLFKLKYCQ